MTERQVESLWARIRRDPQDHDAIRELQKLRRRAYFPGPRFGVIYADPPWSYDDPGAIRRYPGTRRARADVHYDCEGIDDLMAMRPLLDVWAADDCALLMWGTWPKLKEYLDLGLAWGFDWLTCAFVWCKTKRDPDQGRLFPGSFEDLAYCGMGFYTRSGSEFCGLWRRGRPSIPEDRTVRQIVHAPVREHSRKPHEVRQRIEALWPGSRRLEMFARQRWPGWEVWGDQTERWAAAGGSDG